MSSDLVDCLLILLLLMVAYTASWRANSPRQFMLMGSHFIALPFLGLGCRP